MSLPKLIIILGTTACGKSGLGVELAQRFGGEIISADSRQVYRGLDLGTGKITTAEMQGVPHYMLDIISPNESYSVADFQRGAYAAVDSILQRGHVPFLVGGTGLYIRAVTQGFTFTDAKPNTALRAALEGKSAPELYARYRAETGRELNESERQNAQRLIRALEKAASSALEAPPSVPRYQCLQLGVNFPRETVCRRIDQRLQARLEEGMVEEVAALRVQGASDTFLEGLGLEYRYILRYLTGQIPTLDELKDELGRAIKRFAKRQVMWFKRDEAVLWLDMEAEPVEQATRAIGAFLGR